MMTARRSTLRARCDARRPPCVLLALRPRFCAGALRRSSSAARSPRRNTRRSPAVRLIGLSYGPCPCRRLGVFVATCAHVGYAPVAPGTFGSSVALVLYYLIRRQQSTAVELGAIAVIIIVGLWSATEAEHHFGGIDPGPVVIDEVVGMLMTLALHPVNVSGAVIGFLIFRVLDIVKPWPARRLELLPGGFGVVLDDMMAGVYGNLLVWALVQMFPTWLT